MGILNEIYKGNYIENWIDVYINEFKQRGYIVTTDLSMIKHNYGYQLAWGLNDKDDLFNITTNRESNPLTNLYISLNAFKLDENKKPNRRIPNLEQIRNIGIDLDFYKLGISKETVLNELKDRILKGFIPNPNLLIHSGNGLQLIYGINGGLPPKSNKGFDFCNYTVFIANQLSALLVDLGVDTTCTSLDSLFRLPHTYNKKSNYGNKKFVEVEIWNRKEYTINELYDYCKPLEHIQTRKRKKVKQYKNGDLVPFKENKGLTLRSLNSARIYDFLKLVHLRNGEIEKRNILTYDYAFCLSLINDDLEYILKATNDINNLFKHPQIEKELIRTTKNGYKDGQKFWRAYVENDYSMFGLEKKLIKPKKNITIINEHEITIEEQRELNVIIGKEIVYERKVAKRRKEGMKERSEYLNECKEKTNSNLEKIKLLINENPKISQRALAKELGISQTQVRRLIKKMN